MTTSEEQADVIDDIRCASCNTPVTANSKSTPLCDPCREQFIAYPIPLWIKLFGAAILFILAFSLFTLPKNIQTGIHFKRGIKAEEEKNFLTAQKEFARVATEEPGYVEAKCQLLIAAFYNNDFSTFLKTSEALENKKIEDEQLLSQMQSLVGKTSSYFPRDSFVQIMQGYQMETDSIPESIFRNYLSAFPEDYFATYRFASVLFDKKQQPEAESLLNNLLAKEPSYYGAVLLKASIKRESMQLDSSYYFINQLLQNNHQDVYALSSKARTLLKQKKDAEALALAKQTVALKEDDAYALATLALAYHYNNDSQSCNALMKKIEKDTAATSALLYVKDIISGKENFRN